MILIRADANEHIGAGHIMRCLSIANVFAASGEKVVFLTADHKSDRHIQQNGFPIICLDSHWKEMDEEIGKTNSIIETIKPSLFLIDSYEVTENYFSSVSQYVSTAYIDDLNENCWNTDVLINYNIFSSELDYSGYEGRKTKLLLGPRYVPLRDEFIGCKKHEFKDVTNILVSAGGADPEQITEKIIEDICHDYPSITFHFLIGSLNPLLDKIKRIAAGMKNVVLHIDKRRVSELMQCCDIAISAAGVTLYELCACGLPTITYALADNQILAAMQFEKKEIMLNAGDCRSNDGFIEKTKMLLNRLLYNKLFRIELSNRMQELVDGKGAYRIVNELI